MPTDTKPLTDAELEKRLRELHEWFQAQRHAISEEEPPWSHDKHDLWKHLLDAEYYCIESAEEIAALPSEAKPNCPVCKGSGRMSLSPTYPPRSREYTMTECSNCSGTGRLTVEEGKPNV